jgi:hypothetical protein
VRKNRQTAIVRFFPPLLLLFFDRQIKVEYFSECAQCKMKNMVQKLDANAPMEMQMKINQKRYISVENDMLM